MITRDMVLRHLRANPGTTNTHLATWFAVTPALMATKLKQYINGGYVTRIEGPRSITGVKTYLYSAAQGVEGKPKQERVKIAKRTLSQAPKKDWDVTSQPAPTPTLSLDSIVNELANSITQQVIERVKRNLSDGIHNMLPTTAPVEVPALSINYGPICEPLAQEPKPKVEVLPKVGVIGLLPQQAGLVVSKLGNKLDLTFWSADDPFSKLKAMSESCDAVFLHTRHISHTTDSYLKACNAEIVRVTGGTSNMIERIQRYFTDKYAPTGV